MDRITAEFQQAKAENRKSFIAYVCAGDPDYQTSLEVCKELLNAGVHVLELGVPFSDPLADGWTNQCAAKRALDNGFSKKDLFNLVRAIREVNQKVPIVFYVYFNQIFSQGVRAYMDEAHQAGVDALLTLDLPPVEAEEYLAMPPKGFIRSLPIWFDRITAKAHACTLGAFDVVAGFPGQTKNTVECNLQRYSLAIAEESCSEAQRDSFSMLWAAVECWPG